MKQNLRLLLPIFLLVFFACEEIDDKQFNSNIKGGIVITFDDTSVSQWFLADTLLNKYPWKATFCVSNINLLREKDIQKLRILQDSGHEIAGHGLNHISFLEYVSNNSISSYLDREIVPMIEIMKKDSFVVNSFVYPYGDRNNDSDNALLSYFKILRSTTSGIKKPSEHNCYFNNSPVVFGIGIDSHYEHFSEEYLLDLLYYAKINHKILIVYGHTPVINVTNKYQTSISTLILICNYIKENDMKYYTLSDLAKMLK